MNARTPAQGKLLATLIAEFALRAIEVHELRSGGFLIVQRGVTRHVATLEQLEAQARRMGVTT